MKENAVTSTVAKDQSPKKLTNKLMANMRASIIRVDSPTEAVKPVSEQQTPQHTEVNRTPLSELPNGITVVTANPAANVERRLMSTPISANLLRRVSGDKFETPSRRDTNDSTAAQTQTPSVNGETEPQWSAIGHATTTGKSGRVIERLMAENDRLKRDLELQLLRSQELERNLQTMRPQLDALLSENSNLTHSKTVDGSLLARRDRKIETLREELALEKSRREASEALVRSTISDRDDSLEKARREVQQAQEEAKHSTTHATILEQSHRQLSNDYRMRADRWRKDITNVENERRHDQEKLARLEIVTDQMRTELERSRKAHSEFSEQFETYRTATEGWKSEIDRLAIAETQRSKNLSDDMETVVNKMRWVMSNHARQEEERQKLGSA